MNVYEMVTERIIKQLENGVIPWEKPWGGLKDGAFNRVSRKSYSLLNQMLLQHQGEYATFKQWSELDGKVRKGEKAETIVFWKIQPIKEIKEDGIEEIKQIPILKYHSVFHISQVDNVEPLPKSDTALEPIAEADRILMDYIGRENITLKHSASNKAYYLPSKDLIHLPLMEQFQKIEEYYSTAFHEATHSTMTAERCDRKAENKCAAFGSADYSKEELVAELGSANILNILGIETKHSFRNSAAYIQNWLSVLKSDTKFIVSAAGKAEKAVRYILNEEVTGI